MLDKIKKFVSLSFGKPQVDIPAILQTSYPPFAKKAAEFRLAAKKHFKATYGRDVDIHMALRSWETQAKLYAIGRTTELDRKPVTKAKPGLSYHNYGVAVDFVFDGDTTKEGIQWSWDDKYPWSELGALGKTFGFEWAGDWKNFREMPHFQMTYGYDIKTLLALYNEGGLKKVWEAFDKKLEG